MKTKLIFLMMLFALPLFAFDFGLESPEWFTVNDSVMGGVSQSRATSLEEGGVRFSGLLSLENNGGFTSVRANSDAFSIPDEKDLLITVRGDGRRYYFDLRTKNRQRAFSYRQAFQTVAGEVQQIRLPLSGFYATSFGRRLPQASALVPAEVKSVGITLADKNPGAFRLDLLNMELVDPR